MEIRIPVDLEDIFQEAVEVFDSYNDPDDPSSLRKTCQSFLQNLTGKVGEIMEETNYYLALALFGMVKFADEKSCLLCLCDGELPGWDDIKIKKPALGFVQEIRDFNDDLAQKAVVVAFLLGQADKVVRADGSAFERLAVSKNTDETVTSVDELMKGEENEDEYAEE